MPKETLKKYLKKIYIPLLPPKMGGANLELLLNRLPKNSFLISSGQHPKKKSKGQAERTWVKLNPSEQLLATMIATIERAKTSKEWTKDGGEFIPYPSTWLNAKGWEDEYTPDPLEKYADLDRLIREQALNRGGKTGGKKSGKKQMTDEEKKDWNYGW